MSYRWGYTGPLRASLMEGITQSCFQKNLTSNAYEGGTSTVQGFGGVQIIDFFLYLGSNLRDLTVCLNNYPWGVNTVSFCFSG
jgi:hypothetical protein